MQNGKEHRVVRIDLPAGGCDAVVAEGVLDQLGRMAAQRCPQHSGRALLAHDDGLPAATVRRATDALAAAGFGRLLVRPLRAAESAKTLETVQGLAVALAESRHERGDPVIALGGGIVGDVAGFAGAIYRRGVPVVQCPTTLLAMVDASVGGKTGVNLAVAGGGGQLRKNLLGAFHQPVLIVADIGVLGSLGQRQLRCGLAECIKHAMIAGGLGDEGLLEWLAGSLGAMLERRSPALVELVARNIALKAGVVRADERETTGGRALLNFGHTFAHAIETWPGAAPETGEPGPLQHGEAVAIGMVAACRCAARVGLADQRPLAALTSLLEHAGLPLKARGLPDADRLLDLMMDDKKVAGGRLRLVLPVGVGEVRLVDDTPPVAVLEALAAARA